MKRRAAEWVSRQAGGGPAAARHMQSAVLMLHGALCHAHKACLPSRRRLFHPTPHPTFTAPSPSPLQPAKDALDTMVLGAVDLPGLDKYTLIDHSPFDPTIKRTEGVSARGGG